MLCSSSFGLGFLAGRRRRPDAGVKAAAAEVEGVVQLDGKLHLCNLSTGGGEGESCWPACLFGSMKPVHQNYQVVPHFSKEVVLK